MLNSELLSTLKTDLTRQNGWCCTEAEVAATGSHEGEGAQQGISNRSVNGKQGRWEDSEDALEKWSTFF